MLDNGISKKIQPQQAFQAMQTNPYQQGQVPMQADINPELLKENIQDSYIASRVENTTDDPKAMMATAGLMVPTWFAMTQAMDKFAKHSRGEWENTLQYKIAQFGDRVADSSFAKSDFVTGVGKKLKSFGSFIKNNILEKTRITRAMMHTPSIPENGMAVANYIGMPAMQLFDYPQHGEAFTKPLKHLKDLDCYGASQAEINQFISNGTAVSEAEYQTLLKHSRDSVKARALSTDWATANPTRKAEILKDMKAFEWGYNDYAHMKSMAEHTHKNIPEIFEATKNANPKMFARIWGSNNSKLGELSTKIIGREVYASETTNKLFAELGNIDLSKPENAKWKEVLERTGYIDKLPKSSFAKYLNKYTHLITEGATNRVAGGKFIALAQAWFMAEALYKAATADGGIGEKGKVFAERVTELVALFACIPLALKLMHSAGGLQYAGMTKEQIELYRKHLNEHNLKAASGEFATKAEWKASKKALRTELNACVKNPFVKLAKKVGRIISVGLEQIRPWDKNDITKIVDGKKVYRQGIGEKLKDLFRHPKFGLKQMAGYPMRIILGMMIIMPVLSKAAVKTSHLIFGKPKHSLLDEEKEQEAREKAMKVELPDELQNVPVQDIKPEEIHIPDSESNLINQKLKGIPYKEPQKEIIEQKLETTSTQQTNNKANNEPVRTYVPSPVGVKLTNNEDLSRADNALQKADRVEQLVAQTLKMN